MLCKALFFAIRVPRKKEGLGFLKERELEKRRRELGPNTRSLFFTFGVSEKHRRGFMFPGERGIRVHAWTEKGMDLEFVYMDRFRQRGMG